MHLKIALVNKSSVVPETEMEPALLALADQARHAVAVEWGLRLPDVALFTNDPGPPWIPLVIVDEDADVPDALGYHDEQTARAYGRVLAKTCVDNGVSWQSCASHELAEMLGDLHVQQWSNDTHPWVWATELCDPVEGNTYRDYSGVELSDFVLPSWFDPQGVAPFSFMDKHKMDGAPRLIRPFQVAHNGYAILAKAWPNVTQVFADGSEQWDAAKYPEWRLWNLKLTAGSRSLRRHEPNAVRGDTQRILRDLRPPA